MSNRPTFAPIIGEAREGRFQYHLSLGHPTEAVCGLKVSPTRLPFEVWGRDDRFCHACACNPDGLRAIAAMLVSKVTRPSAYQRPSTNAATQMPATERDNYVV